MPRRLDTSNRRVAVKGRRLGGKSGAEAVGPKAAPRPTPKIPASRDALFRREDMQGIVQGNKVAQQQHTMDGQMAREQLHRKAVIGNSAEAALSGQGMRGKGMRGKGMRGGTIMNVGAPDPLAAVRLPRYAGPVKKAINRNTIRLD